MQTITIENNLTIGNNTTKQGKNVNINALYCVKKVVSIAYNGKVQKRNNMKREIAT